MFATHEDHSTRLVAWRLIELPTRFAVKNMRITNICIVQKKPSLVPVLCGKEKKKGRRRKEDKVGTEVVVTQNKKPKVLKGKERIKYVGESAW